MDRLAQKVSQKLSLTSKIEQKHDQKGKGIKLTKIGEKGCMMKEKMPKTKLPRVGSEKKSIYKMELNN